MLGHRSLFTIGAFVVNEIALGVMALPLKEYNLGCAALWADCQEADNVPATWAAVARLLGAAQLVFLAHRARFNHNKLRRLLSVIQMALMLQVAGTLFSQDAFLKVPRTASLSWCFLLTHLTAVQLRSGSLASPKSNPLMPQDAASQALLLHGLALMAKVADLTVFRGFEKYRISVANSTLTSTNIQSWVVLMLLQSVLWTGVIVTACSVSVFVFHLCAFH